MSNTKHAPMKCLLKMQPPDQWVDGISLHSCVGCNKEALGPTNLLHVCSGEAVVPEEEWVKKYKVFGL